MKQRSEDASETPDGSSGVVLGSISTAGLHVNVPEHLTSDFFYFVEWDHSPGKAVGCISAKLGLTN